jgi:hypothetical protein
VQPDIKKYKLVRRGSEKYCLRIKGTMNADDCRSWCREHNMVSVKIKQHTTGYTYRYGYRTMEYSTWNYDLTFNDKRDALGFILGYL